VYIKFNQNAYDTSKYAICVINIRIFSDIISLKR